MTPEDAINRLEAVRAAATREAAESASTEDVANISTRHLGRKSEYTQIKKSLRDLPEDARRDVGRTANQVQQAIEAAIERRLEELEATLGMARLQSERVDVTLPGRRPVRGALHPLTQVIEEIVDVFVGLGFRVVEGPEAETEWYNFQALNIPEDHPARSMWDTLWLEPNEAGQALLRTHTSPVQARVMESTPPPVYVVVPGRVFRRETPDPKHLSVFHQIEGLAVDEGISFADMKGILEAFARQMFGSGQRVRLRPDYFPFTEPSADVSVLCFVCEGSGCRTCRQEGWIEILGAGMVHPNVFKAVGYDPQTTGFAFGLGPERVAMLRYGVEDIRSFYDNDVRFLASF